VLNNLGEVYRQQGEFSKAEETLRRALSMQPQFAEAAFNLGNTLKDCGRTSEAVVCFQQAVTWRPNYAKAHLNLANALRAEGRLPRALVHYQQHLQLQPPRVEVLLSLAGVHADLGEQDLARECTLQAAALEPENTAVVTALGNAAIATGDVAEARTQYGKLAKAQPRSLLPRLRLEALNPVIPQSVEEIEENRSRLMNVIGELRDQRLALNVSLLHASGAEPPMAWAYQGLDNRPLKEAYAGLFSDLIKPVEHKRRTGKPRVGVVVTDGHEGVYSECLGRLVNQLPDEDLDVSVVCSAAGENILKHLLGDTGMCYFTIPDRVDEAAARLSDAEFDLLHYWEIGTGSLNYFLPFFRPAPVQSTCWGWPVTSGQSGVDYFVSSDLLETVEADAHYSERLVRLSTLPTWYKKPPAPRERVSRESCGLPTNGQVYLCTQNLRKYHPDFDLVLGEILRRDPNGHVCVIDDSQLAISRLLETRFRRSIPDVAERVVFLPRQGREEYLRTVSVADVILDTLHYGGGANSLYDAFACGTPVVTWPGAMHRSRFGQAAYLKMGIPDLVVTSASDYVRKAIEIAQNHELRMLLSNRILAANHVLFEDIHAVIDHREFFLTAIACSREV
jgi:predicted O-linked N-acetylglucosamine transferase (SPINDLY family)